MKVLITGIKGFTGVYLRKELENSGHAVFGLSSNLNDIVGLGLEIKQKMPDVVVHLAGISFVNHGVFNEFYNVNLIGTRNLLESIFTHAPNIRKILLASSSGVYGNSLNLDDRLAEESRTTPINDYSVSKLAMENMANIWTDRLPIFIVRPFNYTGIGQDDKFLIPKIASHFLKKINTIELGNLEVYREFGDVRSVVEIYRKLIELPSLENNVVNICTGKAFSLMEVISIFEKISMFKIKINVNEKYVRANEIKIVTGNNDRLKEIIGEWNNYELQDTIEWMLKDRESHSVI
jgi:GDP-6-deoxy-D-talose 4-dehydrogenase